MGFRGDIKVLGGICGNLGAIHLIWLNLMVF